MSQFLVPTLVGRWVRSRALLKSLAESHVWKALDAWKAAAVCVAYRSEHTCEYTILYYSLIVPHLRVAKKIISLNELIIVHPLYDDCLPTLGMSRDILAAVDRDPLIEVHRWKQYAPEGYAELRARALAYEIAD